jgi:hypothetical protein
VIRLIVSGTRHATGANLPQITAALKPICAEGPGVLVYGAAPGVDTLTAQLVRGWGWHLLPVRARWAECVPGLPAELGGCPAGPHRKTRANGVDYCPYAGPRRNQRMTDLRPRPQHVVVFPAAGPREKSRGTWDLHDRAVKAGLNVHPPVPLQVRRG